MIDIDYKVDFLANGLLEILDAHALIKTMKGKRKPYPPLIALNIRLMQYSSK